jgi:hypothetical protein
VAFVSTKADPVFVNLTPDLRVLGFAAGLAVITCLLFGVVPAIRVTRFEPGAVIKGGGRGMTAGRERFSLRRALVVVQVALSLVLVAGAGLFLRTYVSLALLGPGFTPDGLSVAAITLPDSVAPAERARWVATLQDAAGNAPGVRRAAASFMTPMSGWSISARESTGPRSRRTP